MGTSDPIYFPWQEKLAHNLEPILYGREKMKALSIGEVQAPSVYYFLKKINIKFKEIKTFDFCEKQTNLTKYMVEESFQRLNNQIHIKGNFNKKLSQFSDQKFDFITAFRCTPHLTQPEDFLREIYRILKPGGVLIIDWVNGYSNFPLLDLGFCWHSGDADVHRGDSDIYDGNKAAFNQTSYIDQTFLDLFPEEFNFLINQINRPNLRKRIEAFKNRKWKLAFNFPNKYKFFSAKKLSLTNYEFEFGLEMKNKKLNLLSNQLIDELGFKILHRDVLNPYKFNKKTIIFLSTIITKNK